MDAGGFVDLAALLRFGLIAALAADAAELADAACGSCGVLETTVVTSVVTGACRVWPRVLGARRTPQQRGGSWVLGGWWRVGKRLKKSARCRVSEKTGGNVFTCTAAPRHRAI